MSNILLNIKPTVLLFFNIELVIVQYSIIHHISFAIITHAIYVNHFDIASEC